MKVFLFGFIALAIIIFISFNLTNTFVNKGGTQTYKSSIKKLTKNSQLSQLSGSKKNTQQVFSQFKEKVKETKNEQKKFTVEQIEEKINRVNVIYEMNPKEILLYMDELKDHQKIIQNFKRTNGIKLERIDLIEPEMAITLSILVDKEIPSALEIDTSELPYSARDWYYIKTFSQSGDLQKLMAQDRLTKEYINIENLAMVYSNNVAYSVDENGKIEGKPSDLPPIVIENPDNTPDGDD